MADIIIVAVIIILVAVIAVRYVVRVSSGGCNCGCGGSERAPRPKPVEVKDTDATHYPYTEDLLIGGMNCEGCARNIENALNALEGTWAQVELEQKTAHVRSKTPIDRDACARAIRGAGYSVRSL